MKTTTNSILVLLLFLLLIGCSKKKISERKLFGNTYTVQDFAWYQNMYYEAWKNNEENIAGEGGKDIENVNGKFTFSDEGVLVANFTYEGYDWLSNWTTIQYKDSGLVNHNGNWFSVENGLDFKTYTIHERDGKEMWLYFNTLPQGGYDSDVLFFKLKRD